MRPSQYGSRAHHYITRVIPDQPHDRWFELPTAECRGPGLPWLVDDVLINVPTALIFGRHFGYDGVRYIGRCGGVPGCVLDIDILRATRETAATRRAATKAGCQHAILSVKDTVISVT